MTSDSASVLSVAGLSPEVDESAFLAAGARVIGDVRLGPESSVWYNAVLRGDALEDLCRLDGPTKALVRSAMERGGLSARGFHRCVRVARTIADLAGSEDVTRKHFAEAFLYRGSAV